MFRRRADGRQSEKPDLFDQAIDYNLERYLMARRSMRRAYIVAGAGVVVGLTGLFTAAALAPLKSVEPFVIRVDQTTGAADVVHAAKGEESTYGDVTDRYWIGLYVRQREAYLRATAERQYELVGLMSGAQEKQRWNAYFDPNANVKSPVNDLDVSGRIDVDITAISFIAPNVAYVRFTRKISRPGTSVTEFWAAQVEYRYNGTPSDEKLAQDNPLGFEVPNYQASKEVMGG